MFDLLPTSVDQFESWQWEQIEPYFINLAERPLTSETVATWLGDWAALKNLIAERFARLRVLNTQDTTDEAVEETLQQFLKEIFSPSQKYDNELIQQLLDSGLTVDNMELPLKKMRSDAELFSEENLPLFNKEVALAGQYNRIIGAQSVEWAGEIKTLMQLRPLMDSPERDRREKLWRLLAARQLEDREPLNLLWQQLLDLRQRIAKNAGYNHYLGYRWQLLKRFDYSPDDARAFHDAIEQKVVPAASRIYARMRQELGVATLRPWDVAYDYMPIRFPKPTPMRSVDELAPKANAIFEQVAPVFGDYFKTMRDEALLDLPNRVGKAPGGYCTYFAVQKRPFIFMNAVGTAADVRTMLHEAGHAFHAFESNDLPYPQQRHPGHEFSEVASMTMELLSAPYLTTDFGGYYDSTHKAALHQIDHLRRIITFWPFMAVVDAFQHWVYQHEDLALNPGNCDAKWAELWYRFLPEINWDGFEDVMMTGWHRKQHIFRSPLYYIEYGMAQVGALQVWANALEDKENAIRRYRDALALGGTRSLKDLYAIAGGEFRFDTAVMENTIALLEDKIGELAALKS